MRRTPMKPRTKPMSRGASLVSTARLERHTRIKTRSDKTARIYVTRRALVAEMFLYPEVCEVPWCSNVATDPHEPLTRARLGSILDPSNIRKVCHPCNVMFGDKEEPWMYELGFLVHSWDGAA